MVARELLISVILQYCVLCLVYCKEKNFRSLLITQIGETLEFAKPFEYNKDEEKASYKRPSTGQVYQFCAKEVSVAHATAKNLMEEAWYMDRTFKAEETFNDASKCANIAQPVFARVKFPDKIKSHWNSEVELYHSGYLLYTNDIKADCGLLNVLKWINPKNCIGSKSTVILPEYELIDSDYEIVLGLEIHFNKIYEQVVAVEYKLLSTPIVGSHNYNAFGLAYPHEQVPSVIDYEKNNNDRLFLERKVGPLWHKYVEDYDRMGNLIYAQPLAPLNHFPISMWRFPAQVRANIVPLWYPVISRSKNIASFVRYVAEYLGDLKVSVGITGIMSLPGMKKQSHYHFSNGLSDEDENALHQVDSVDLNEEKFKNAGEEKEDKSEASVIFEHSSQNEVQDVSRPKVIEDVKNISGEKNSSDEQEVEKKEKRSSNQDEMEFVHEEKAEKMKDWSMSNSEKHIILSDDVENTTTVLLEEKENKFRMPDYYWTAYEYNDEKVWYGIFVVMNCNPFINTPNICEDVCDTNGWPLSNQNFKEGKVYCCEMTTENINKLEAQFLLDRERKPFNLHNWKEKRDLILQNSKYEQDISSNEN